MSDDGDDVQRVYQVWVDGERLGGIWTWDVLRIYLRLLYANGEHPKVRLREANLGEWRDVPSHMG